MSPEVNFGDYLLCLNLYRQLDPKKFDALLEKVKPVAARNACSGVNPALTRHSISIALLG